MKAMDEDILQVLVTEEQLKAKVQQLGEQISRDYEGKDLLLVSILKGSVVFMADIMRAIKIPSAIDFMVVSSYGGANTTTTGLVKIIKDLDSDLSGILTALLGRLAVGGIFWAAASCLFFAAFHFRLAESKKENEEDRKNE